MRDAQPVIDESSEEAASRAARLAGGAEVGTSRPMRSLKASSSSSSAACSRQVLTMGRGFPLCETLVERTQPVETANNKLPFQVISYFIFAAFTWLVIQLFTSGRSSATGSISMGRGSWLRVAGSGGCNTCGSAKPGGGPKPGGPERKPGGPVISTSLQDPMSDEPAGSALQIKCRHLLGCRAVKFHAVPSQISQRSSFPPRKAPTWCMARAWGWSLLNRGRALCHATRSHVP